MASSNEKSTIRSYLALCANPIRDEAQVLREYHELAHYPRVVTIGFYRPDVLMVGTDPMVIQYEGHRYNVGEFIIFLIRRKVGNYWETGFRFRNVTVAPRGDRLAMHPHILVALDGLLPCLNGKLCISRGQFPVYQMLRKGEMHRVVRRLIEILEMYPTGLPYEDVGHWPRVEEMNHA